MSHHCHAEGCTREVAPRYFACAKHWRLVPYWLQQALWRVYTSGQEVLKNPSPAYLVVQARCRLAIAEAEGLDADVARVRQELAQRARDTFETLSGFADDGELVAHLDGALGAP